jgi:hypothetical protein
MSGSLALETSSALSIESIRKINDQCRTPGSDPQTFSTKLSFVVVYHFFMEERAST